MMEATQKEAGNSNPILMRARVEYIEKINAIIAAAKTHWHYPEPYLRAAIELLQINSRYLVENLGFEILKNGETVGFTSIADKEGEKYLDHLWVHPDFHGLGLGRMACERLFSIAHLEGWNRLLVLPDPKAEGFYFRMGFLDTGTRVASRISGGPTFSLLEWTGLETAT